MNILLPHIGRLDWGPFAEMRRMQNEMNRLFAEIETGPTTVVFLPINIWVGKDSAAVMAELPGMAEKDIDLSVREDTLTIQGKR